MSNDDTITEAPVTAAIDAPQDPYVGRHAKAGKADQGPDEETSYDAKHDDIDGPPGAVSS